MAFWLLGFLASCKNKNTYKSGTSLLGNDGYSDGIYCANVEYHHPNTGTNSSYTLKVRIENNELTIIYWSNGGWLDDSHFYPPDISDGYADFESDRGIEYSVEIIGAEADCYTSRYAPSSEEEEQEADYLEEEQEAEQDYLYGEDEQDEQDEQDEW